MRSFREICRSVSMLWGMWLVVFLLAGNVEAQVSRGTILGTIVDESGAVVPNVKVLITQVATNFSRTTVTSELGSYEVVALPVGEYAVEAEIQGFAKVAQTKVSLSAQQRLRIDFTLKPSATSETVTVVGEAPLVEGDSSVRGQVIGNKTIIDLPLNGRDFMDLPLLSAGVNIGAPGNAQSFYFDKTISANGMPADSNEYYVDGIVSTVPLDSLPGVRHSPESIQEFKVMTSGYSAEFGGKSGIHLNLISKSGTNQWHGGLFEFIRNDILDARNFFALGKPPFRRNNFGANLGGPVLKDKMFFFFAYEGTRSREGVARVSRVPTAAQLAGDLSGLPQIYNPFSTRPDSDRPGQLIRDPFPGNIIPANLIDRTAVTIAKRFYPTPNAPDPIRNYVFSGSVRDNIDIYTGRVDLKLSDKNTMFSKYSFSTRPRYNPGSFPLLGGDDQLIRPQNVVVNDTYVFSPQTLVEFGVGYNRFIANFIQQNVGKDIAGENGIRGTSRDPFTFGTPILSISDFASISEGAFRPNVETDNSYQATAKLSHRRGSHSLKFGVDIRKAKWHQFTDGFFNGSFAYTGTFTTRQSSAGSASGLADMLLGVPASATVSGGRDRVRMGSWSIYPFLSDDWQVTPNLTLNLGLRWEYNDPWREEQDRWAFFNRTSGKAEYPRTANFYGETPPFPFELVDRQDLFKARHRNIAPRFGFAYRPLGSSRTAIRGGYGIFYNNPFSVDLLNVGGNFPWRLTRTVISDPIVPQLNIRDALVSSVLPPLFNLTHVHNNERREGLSQHWSLGIQQELFAGIAVDLGYVGSKRDHWLIYGVPYNQVQPGPGAVQPRRPFLRFNNTTAYQTDGSGSYHALQARVEKRMAKSLSFLTSYTWSKTLDDNAGFEGSRLINPYKEKALSSQHRAHLLTTALNYLLPVGKGQPALNNLHPVLDGMLGGWQVSGILTLSSGSPFSPGFSGDRANCACTNRPDRIGNGNLPSSERSITRWFDASAFVTSAQFVHGNAGRNILIGPGLQNVDFGLFKNFQIRERNSLQFRWESFNAFNHANFGQPSATVNIPATAGRIFGAAPGRQMQFGLKWLF